MGCDGQMNSTETYDDCGVCGGNGSDCKLVKGTYERMFRYERCKLNKGKSSILLFNLKYKLVFL